MKVNIRKDSVPVMIELMRSLKKGTLADDMLDELLDHPDYVMEFSRYNKGITREVFADYLKKFPALTENDISNINLRIHHKYYRDFYEDPDTYEKSLSLLDFDSEALNEQAQIAKKGLPDDLKIEQVDLVFTIGIGPSFGYIHGNNIHFDFLQLVKEKSKAEFDASIAHEIHHVGFNALISEEAMRKLSLEELFYLYFSGEGLAVKYCNNAEGNLSKSIYPGPKNIGLDPYSWNYLNRDFENMMRRFKSTLGKIRNGTFTTEDFQKELKDYWMNPYHENQDDQAVPALKQLRLYSFGNEIWGVIHDAFGKAKVFETLRNLKTFPEVYNQALAKLGKKTYTI